MGNIAWRGTLKRRGIQCREKKRKKSVKRNPIGMG
jgi:hypothetical protein